PGESLGVLSEYGPHSLGSTGLAGLRRAVVMRGGQFLPENPIGTGGLSRAILRGSGQIYGGGPTRLGLHRTPVHPGARRKGQVLWRHYPTASGRACPRVADWSVADGAGDGRYRACVTTLLAGNGLTALLFSFLPSCQGAKTPLRHPWAFCAYATVVKATSVSDFRQCAVRICVFRGTRAHIHYASIRRRAARTKALASSTVHGWVGRKRYLIPLISVAFIIQLESCKHSPIRDKIRRVRAYLSSVSTRKYSSSTAYVRHSIKKD